MRFDDLAPLLAPPPTPGVGFRQGVVSFWNPLTAQNTVDVGGATLTDVPILNTNEALLLQPGDVVALLTTGQGAQSWWIVGRVTIPGTAQAATALTMLSRSIKSATVAAIETTTSSSYTNLPTVGPTVADVLVTSSGKCLVVLTAEIWQGASGSFPSAVGGNMSFDTAGPTSIGPSDGQRALSVAGSGLAGDVASFRMSAFVYLDGLTAGTYSFTAKYRSLQGGQTAEFGNRNITVIAL